MAVVESLLPNEFKIGRQSDGSQGITFTERILFNMCDGVRYCDPHQGSTTMESPHLDGSNGRMKDEFRDILRGTFTIETMISVDSGCEIGNVLSWQVYTQAETNGPTSISNPRDCQCPSVDRESEFIPSIVVVNDPWVGYHVGMLKLQFYTVDTAPWNEKDSHGYRCNGWIQK